MARWAPNWEGPHGGRGSSNHGSDIDNVLGARQAVLSWIEDGDMVYMHHWCLRGPMLPLLHVGSAHVVVMLTNELVVYMTPKLWGDWGSIGGSFVQEQRKCEDMAFFG